VSEAQILVVSVQRTLRWMARTRPRLKVLPAWVVELDTEQADGKYALIFPDGSYRVATLGKLHDPPKEVP
jgi:hypothetical protein